jgi:hypothetical protein
MTRRQAIAFVRKHGVVLESARGRVPSLAEAVAGGPIKGSWRSHPKSHKIFALTQIVRDSNDVLVCRVVDGKVTFVHRRLSGRRWFGWPTALRMNSSPSSERSTRHRVGTSFVPFRSLTGFLGKSQPLFETLLSPRPSRCWAAGWRSASDFSSPRLRGR